MTINNRQFGIEIEFVGASLSDVERRLRDAGIDAHREGYNHVTRPYWKLVTDASLSHHSGLTGELVSPILKGAEGFAELRRVCDVLNGIDGLTVNRSCGLHVHLDCQDMTVAEIAKVFERYADYENQIDLLLPRSRRGEARWCRSISNHKNLIKTATSKEGQAYALGRYFKVNLTNIATRGAMEFRQHSGTTDYRKISNWVLFLMQFVEASIAIASNIASAPKVRLYNEVRNVLENMGYAVEWSKGKKAWRVTKVSSNRVCCYLTNSEVKSVYDVTKRSQVWSRRQTSEKIRRTALWALLESKGLFQEGLNSNQIAFDYSNSRVAGIADTGFDCGVERAVMDYIGERISELN